MTPAELLAYLDRCIAHHRVAVAVAEARGDELAHRRAMYYVDAFQSVRVSAFGALLPTPDGSPVVQQVIDA